jgi:hypothetical protein
MKKIVVLGLLISFLISCSVLHVEKRRYRKGFHVAWNKKNKSSDNKESIEVANKGKDEERIASVDLASSDKETVSSIKVDRRKTDRVPLEEVAAYKRRAEKFSHKPSKTMKVGLVQKADRLQRVAGNTKFREQREGEGTNALYYFFLLGLVPVIAF